MSAHPVGSGAAAWDSDSGLDGREPACTGVSESETTRAGLTGSLLTGGLGARFLVSKEGEDAEEAAANGDTGGLLLACRAASFGECLRFGGIGVPDFCGLVLSGVTAGGAIFSSSSEASPPLCSTKGAILASMVDDEMMAVGSAAFDSGVGAGANRGEGSDGSLAGVDRLQVRVVVSLEGLS